MDYQTGKKVGLLTTYNQLCGIAEYSKTITKYFDPNALIILAERIPAEQLTEQDASNVRRCWSRGMTDYSELERVITDEHIGLIHLNCQYRFFEPDSVRMFLSRVRLKGVKVIVHVHTTYTIDATLQALVQNSDRVIVHTPENGIEAVANGANPENLRVVDLGAPISKKIKLTDARQKLGLPENQKVAVCFGFIQAHKGIKEAIQAVQTLRLKLSDLHLYVVGVPLKSDATGQQYYESLKTLVHDYALEDKVHLIDRYVSSEEVELYLSAADVVVMYYLSFYYEASAAVAEALGCGAPIVTSSTPTFSRLHDAVFHVTGGYPLPFAIELVVTNQLLNSTLRKNAIQWATVNSRFVSATKIAEIYSELLGCNFPVFSTDSFEHPSAQKAPSVVNKAKPKSQNLRVLMNNRPHAYTHRGGDTVVMDEVAKGLRAMGITVDIDLEAKLDPRNYDIVHLHNFATPEITKVFAENCVRSHVPYVVTTMYEDLPIFYNQMHGLFQILQKYIEFGQPREKWGEFIELMKQVTPGNRWENAWTAEHAAALIASGERERQTLLRDYPNTKYAQTYRLGCEVSEFNDDGSLFIKETGIKDFVLCVGRLETRKNQLMLLKALEESPLTVVFATGGFTYQPEYEQLCRSIKRVGQTHFLGRLSPEILSSAYAAANVHALPSWYELPGIVSMEAARRGVNVVACDRGTAWDYFGEKAYYCEPDNAESIYNAVVAAYYAPTRKGLEQTVADCTWDNAAKRVLSIYEHVLGIATQKDISVAVSVQNQTSVREQMIPMNTAASAKNEAICVEADTLMKKGQVAEAEKLYLNVVGEEPLSVRALRGLGVAALQQTKFDIAKNYFIRAQQIDSADARTLAGLGASEWGLGEREDAYQHYIEAITLNPDHLPTIYYLIDASYVLNRLATLRDVLSRFVKRNPQNIDIQYCLAGCLFKNEEYAESKTILNQIFQIEPAHREAQELLGLIEQKLSQQSVAPKTESIATAPFSLKIPSGPKVMINVSELEALKEKKDYPGVVQKADKIINDSMASNEEKILAKLFKAEALAATGEVNQADNLLNSLGNGGEYRFRMLTDQGAIAAANSDWVRAESLFTEALSLKPDYDVALAGIGVCAASKNEANKAWEFFNKAINVNPENLRALLGIVQLGYLLNRIEDIENHTRNYLEFHPANVSILYSHAGSLYALKRYNDAQIDLQRALIFEPNNELVLELLQKIKEQLQN